MGWKNWSSERITTSVLCRRSQGDRSISERRKSPLEENVKCNETSSEMRTNKKKKKPTQLYDLGTGRSQLILPRALWRVNSMNKKVMA